MSERGLFPPPPRQAPRKLMHVAEASGGMIRLVCKACGYDTDWIKQDRTTTEYKRGVPCPTCNGAQS